MSEASRGNVANWLLVGAGIGIVVALVATAGGIALAALAVMMAL